MDRNLRLIRDAAFRIETFGNGLVYEITRIVDGATAFLQGDDAVRLGHELGQTSDRFTDDDVASQYFA